MFLPPFKAIGGAVECPGTEEEVKDEGNRWQRPKVDEIFFPGFVKPESRGGNIFVPMDDADDIDEVSSGEVLGRKRSDIDIDLRIRVGLFLDKDT